MKKKRKKLTACALVAVLGLSFAVYPVYAQEEPATEQTDTGELLELDETAVPMEEATIENPMESNIEEQNNQSSTEDSEPASQGQAETKANANMTASEPEQIEETINTNEPAVQPKRQEENSIQPYANDTGNFVVTGGTYGTDYTYDGNLHILTSTKLTITTNGKATSSMIRGDTRGITYNIVFRDLYLNGKQNDSHVVFLGHINLTIFGTNKIDVYGVGFTSGSLTITADSTGSLSLNAEGDSDIWLTEIDSSNANLEVNGGSLTYGDAEIYGSITTSGTGTINGKTYPKVPTPTFTTTQTASSITVNLSNYQSEYGTAKYKLDNGEWGTNNTFSNLKANSSHTVYVKYEGQGNYQPSDEANMTITTKQADYTISIPASPETPLEAGNSDSTSTISVNQQQPFDLGYNGQVDVKVKKNDKVTDTAELKLTRQNDTENHTITSALLVNGTALGNINTSVATFKNKSDSPVSVSFEKPTEANIPAGTYNGTIIFEVSYSEK